jgi:FkbM family methyltransferase
VFQRFKNYLRRRRLQTSGIRPAIAFDMFTAGARSGVWSVWPAPLRRDSVVYSFGVGDNLAWDLALVERFGLTVHAFDPTPASVAWVARQALPPGLVFHPIGLAAHDGMLPFSLPSRGSRFNFRPLADARSASNQVEAPVRRLRTLMRELGHERLDVLKMDIEGGEYAAIEDLLANPVNIGQLLIEFHHHFPGIGLPRTVAAIHALERAGYRIFHISERGLEFSFVHESTLALANAA